MNGSVSLTRLLDFTGKSGVSYRYREHEGQVLSPTGANFLYVKVDKDAASVIYAGEASSLLFDGFDGWDEARKAHGANRIFVRLNVTSAVRRAEQADIIDQHLPPMNAPPVPKPASARKAAAKPPAKASKPPETEA